MDNVDTRSFGTHMSLGEHILELRKRLIVTLSVFVIIFFICIVSGRYLITFAQMPLRKTVTQMQLPADTIKKLNGVIKPMDGFTALIRFSLVVTMLISLPVAVQQLWVFVEPGLTERERKALKPIFAFGSVMFLLGMVLAFLYACPIAFRFLLSFNTWLGFDNVWTGESIISLTTAICIGFGVVFELPLVLMILGYCGIVSDTWLATHRRHSILAMFVIGAILTPPDPITQLLMAGTMVILYEISILLIRSIK